MKSKLFPQDFILSVYELHAWHRNMPSFGHELKQHLYGACLQRLGQNHICSGGQELGNVVLHDIAGDSHHKILEASLSQHGSGLYTALSKLIHNFLLEEV